jgi:hypothetical protein
LLGRQASTSITESTGEQNKKNTSEDVDTEMFTLQGFLRMVAEGQVVALDMLFATPESWVEGMSAPQFAYPFSYEDWFEVCNFAKANLLSKNTTAYIGYCRKQAAKYGIRGSRVGEVRALLDFLKQWAPEAKLYEINGALEEFLKDKEFTSIVSSKVESRNIGGGGVKNIWADSFLGCGLRRKKMRIIPNVPILNLINLILKSPSLSSYFFIKLSKFSHFLLKFGS